MPLHPQARSFLDALAIQKGRGWEEMTPAEAREAFSGLRFLFGTGPELFAVEETTLDGSIPARIYRPSSAQPLPAVMYFHGGGWVFGDLETHDTLCRRLAKESGCVLISVGYRRAPEHRFPAAQEDCFQATVFVAKHAEEFGIDANRLAVCGDSAGGNLAATVSLRARDGGGPAIHSQWLLYPVIEANFETPSYLAFAEGHALTRAAMQWFWNHYAPALEDRTDPLAAPSHAPSLAGLPPAYILTAECDPLRDEGEAFAAQLQAAGVDVTLRRYDGMLHGFLHFSEPFDAAPIAIADLAAAMKRALTA